MISNQDPTCQDCGKRMEEGFVVDHMRNGMTSQTWVSGTPRRSLWFGLQLKGRDTFAVETYRCPRCGKLVSYAREPKRITIFG